MSRQPPSNLDLPPPLQAGRPRNPLPCGDVTPDKRKPSPGQEFQAAVSPEIQLSSDRDSRIKNRAPSTPGNDNDHGKQQLSKQTISPKQPDSFSPEIRLSSEETSRRQTASYNPRNINLSKISFLPTPSFPSPLTPGFIARIPSSQPQTPFTPSTNIDNEPEASTPLATEMPSSAYNPSTQRQEQKTPVTPPPLPTEIPDSYEKRKQRFPTKRDGDS